MVSSRSYRHADEERIAAIAESECAERIREQVELAQTGRAMRRSATPFDQYLAPLAVAGVVTSVTFGLACMLLRTMPTAFFGGFLSFGWGVPLFVIPPAAGLVAGFVVLLRSRR